MKEPDLAGVKAVLLDLDGTVYRGSEAVPGAPEAIHRLLVSGFAIRYLTNNSAARPEGITRKLKDMGIPCEPSWVAGTGPAAAMAVKGKGFKRAHVVGEPGLWESFKEAGIEPSDGEPLPVLVSGICRTFDYAMMDRALQTLLGGAFWIATNRDGSYPLEGGRFQPGAGSIVAALEAAAARPPDLVIGKPEPLMIHQIAESLGVSAPETLMAGDREDTDLEAGRRAGAMTWLVLTGYEKAMIPGQDGSADLLGLAEALGA